jgi:hypothetical protein
MYSDTWNYLNINKRSDKIKIFDTLVNLGIFKKFMPAYLQSIDLTSDKDVKGDRSTLSQLCSHFIDNSDGIMASFSKKKWEIEDEFLSDYEFFALNLPSDEEYMSYRRDLMILDIHELVKFTGACRKDASNFFTALRALKAFTASFLYDYLFRDQVTMELAGM